MRDITAQAKRFARLREPGSYARARAPDLPAYGSQASSRRGHQLRTQDAECRHRGLRRSSWPALRMRSASRSSPTGREMEQSVRQVSVPPVIRNLRWDIPRTETAYTLQDAWRILQPHLKVRESLSFRRGSRRKPHESSSIPSLRRSYFLRAEFLGLRFLL